MAEQPQVEIEREDLVKYMKRYFSKNSSAKKVFSVLVIGETGSGKSTLVNNLLGKDVSPVGESVESHTTEIVAVTGEVEGVPVHLFDTPGLGDTRSDMDAKILADMRNVLESTEINVVIYCFKMNETRLRDSLVRIFQEYHKVGVKWQQTVIALTFADALPMSKNAKKAARERGLELVKKEVFQEKFDEWKKHLKKVLHDHFEVEEIKIRPTTDLISRALPNAERWFIPFWLDVLEILSPDAKISFLEMHKQKICEGSFQHEELHRLQHIMLHTILMYFGIMMLNVILRLKLQAIITPELLNDLLTNSSEDGEERPEEDCEEMSIN